MNDTKTIVNAIIQKGTPSPIDILYILQLYDYNPSKLAEDLKVSRPNITQVIYGKHASLPVAEHIAYITNLSVRSLFGDRYDRLIKVKRKKVAA